MLPVLFPKYLQVILYVVINFVYKYMPSWLEIACDKDVNWLAQLLNPLTAGPDYIRFFMFLLAH